MRAMHKLVARAILRTPKGTYEDGGGLRLVKRSESSGYWVFRYMRYGKSHGMGLGGWPSVTLKEARDSAANARATIRNGADPIAERERVKREATRNFHLLEDVANDAFHTRKAELKGDGLAGRWFSPLAIHVLPKLGRMPVAEIDQVVIREAMAPIWKTKAATAEKALQRLGIVIRHAAALGYAVDLQAVDKARALLGGQGREVEHIPSMHWTEVPAFYASLTEPTACHLALRMVILTGLRSAPVRNMRIDHISGNVLTVPAALMKGTKGKVSDFDVPLCEEALAVIEAAKPFSTRDGLLFPGRSGKAVSDMTLSRHMERLGLEARPHGFRSSIRVYMAEKARAPRDIAEMILGHAVGSKVEQAYQRSSLIEIRREYLDQWAGHVTGKTAITPPAEIIPLDDARRAGDAA